MTLDALLIIALATWRLSYMLVNERGPFAWFASLRKGLGIQRIEMITQNEWGSFPGHDSAPSA